MYGFNDFTVGDTPGATDFDGIMRQTIMGFADVATRDTELAAVLEEGLVAQTLDDETFWRYDGSDWEILFEREKAWTPTITQGSTVANTLDWGSYKRSYGRWDAGFQTTFTAAGTAGNEITITPPFTTIGVAGTFTFFDDSLGVFRVGTVLPGPGGTIALAVDLAADYYGNAASDGITADDTLVIDMHGSY